MSDKPVGMSDRSVAGEGGQEPGLPIDIVDSRDCEMEPETKESKAKRLQWLLQQLIRETLQENNSDLCREIRESVVKELDYQFRMQEEREEARDRMLAERDEEHYKRMDELLRKKSRLRKPKPEKNPEKNLEKSPEGKDRERVTEGQAEGKKKRRFL